MSGQMYYAIDMYIDWFYGFDDEIRQDDVIDYCNSWGLVYEEVVKLGNEVGGKRKRLVKYLQDS